MDASLSREFTFERVLNEDPLAHSVWLLGSMRGSPTLVKITKTALDASGAETLLRERLNLKVVEDNGVYCWFEGWTTGSASNSPEYTVHVIHPADEKHIAKYSKQETRMFTETPEIYQRVVKPFIASIPASRTSWVLDILSGRTESEKVLYRDSDFVLIPDMKWDLRTVFALYLVALCVDPSIRTLRDLRARHIPMLRNVRREAGKAAKQKWGVGEDRVRCYVHYQPTYYHFHVHIVHAEMHGYAGMRVGQAHLLEDLVSLLELDTDDSLIMERLTFTYGLGEQHGLWDALGSSGTVSQV